MKRFPKIFLLLTSLAIILFSLNNFNKVLAQEPSCSVSPARVAIGEEITVTAAHLALGPHPIRLATMGDTIDLGVIRDSFPETHVGVFPIPEEATAPEYQVQIDQGAGNWLVCTPNITVTEFDIPPPILPDSPVDPDFTAENLISLFITRLLPIVLGLAGFLTVIIIVISGIQFITSSGNPEAAAAARGRLIFALVGFTIIILAFAITQIVDRIFLGGTGVF